MTFLPDLQRRLDDVAARYDIPGAAVAVGQGDRLAEAATGVVNRNTGVAATPDSVFQIGSVTKVWTTTLVMQLVDEGTVDLDRPVRRYLPEFAVADPRATETVTVRHLLSHTGGFDGDLFEDTGRGDDALNRYVEYLHGAAQVHAPGALFSYCNSGFCVLGALAARLRGGTWESVLRERVIGPLGATHMALLPEEALLLRASAGHVKLPGADGQTVYPGSLPRSNAPAGATPYAAPRDLVRFGRMFLAGGIAADGRRLLSEDAIAAMRTPQAAVPGATGYEAGHWGLGFELFRWDGTPVIGHDGGTPGQSTIWRIVPDHDFVIAVNANGGDVFGLVAELISPVIEEVTGVAVPAPPVPPDTPAEVPVDAYAGRYTAPLLGYEVTAAPGGLDITIEPGELAAGMGMARRTDRYVHLYGETFIAVEAEESRHPTVTFVDGGRYLHNGRAVPRVEQ
jgi:CubicO group peptidase (beta-lactamase class C family)